jgi:hypothetical protein
MSEVTFGKNQTPVAGVEVESKTGVNDAVATPSQTSVAKYSDQFAGDFIPGFKDIVLKRVNLVQCVGGLKDTFIPGSLVYAQSAPLFIPPDIAVDKATGNVTIKREATPPVEMTVLGFKFYGKNQPFCFSEKVSGGERGMVCYTEEQVRAVGGTLDYKEWELKRAAGMKRFEYMSEVRLIVKCPAGLDADRAGFAYKAGGDRFAIAVWTMKGSAYNAACKSVLFTERQTGVLRNGGYSSWSFAVTTRDKVFSGNKYFVPSFVPNAPTTPAVTKFVGEILNPVEAAPVEDGAE